MAEAAPLRDRKGYRVYVLALLLIVYTFNFLDRQILGILKDPIQAELGLSDTQVGLMGGLAFALLYSTAAVPIAWLADRFSRVWIMTGALALWSGFTALCGMTHSFTQIFLARMGVGIGEAGGVAPSYSMIADYFPKHQRARALAFYSFGIPIGTASGVLFGGLIAASINWRIAFIIVGAAGLVLAPIFRLTVRDPKRGGLDAAAVDGPTTATAEPAAPPPAFREVIRILLPKPSFWLLAVGAAASSVCGYGVAYWLPTFFQRSMHLTLAETAWFYSGVALVGGMGGIWLGGVLADRFGKARRGAYPLVPAVAFLVALPCFLLAMNTSNVLLSAVLFLIPTGLNLAWLGPIVTAVQHLVPANMRTTGSALFLLLNNLLGIGGGLYFYGAMSDLFKPWAGAESMRWAIYSGLGFYVLAALLFILASARLTKDWVE
jgi:sugar phosphate permease